MSIRKIEIIILTFLLIAFHSYPIFAEKDEYLSFVQQDGEESAGYLEIKIKDGIVRPADWHVKWFVSLYSHKGYKIFLGSIEDSKISNKIFAKMTPGTYRVEISREKEAWSAEIAINGIFDIDKGDWHPYDFPLQKEQETQIQIKEKEVVVLEIAYSNPDVLKSKDRREFAYIWTNFSTNTRRGTPQNLKLDEFKPHPLAQYAKLLELDEKALITASITGTTKVSAIASFALKKATLIGNQPNIEFIIELIKEKSPKLSWPAVEFLATTKDKRLVEALLVLLQNSSIKEKNPIIWLLGELGDLRATPKILSFLKNSSLMTKNYASYALARIADQITVPALIEATNDKDSFRAECVLISFCEKPSLFYLNRETGWKEFQALPGYEVRINAIFALGQIRNSDLARDHLLSILDAKEEYIRRASIKAVSNFSGPEVEDALIKKLKDEPSVKFLAIAALKKIGSKKAIPYLKEIAKNDPAENIRNIASEAVSKLSKLK